MFPTSLQSASIFLIEHGMLGVLITMPPALLLVLGLKKKGRWSLLFCGASALSLACVITGISLEGIETGNGLALSKSTLMVDRTSRPVFFWISTVAFLTMSAAIALGGVFLIWRGLRPSEKKPKMADVQ